MLLKLCYLNGEVIVEVATSGATGTAAGGRDVPFAIALRIDFPDGRDVNAVGNFGGVGFPVGIRLKNEHLGLLHEMLGCLYDIRGEAKVADLFSLLSPLIRSPIQMKQASR
jgi:hypothetical protein